MDDSLVDQKRLVCKKRTEENNKFFFKFIIKILKLRASKEYTRSLKPSVFRQLIFERYGLTTTDVHFTSLSARHLREIF